MSVNPKQVVLGRRARAMLPDRRLGLVDSILQPFHCPVCGYSVQLVVWHADGSGIEGKHCLQCFAGEFHQLRLFDA